MNRPLLKYNGLNQVIVGGCDFYYIASLFMRTKPFFIMFCSKVKLVIFTNWLQTKKLALFYAHDCRTRLR